MSRIAAFIGHSFLPEDEAVVRSFCKYFDELSEIGIDFSWEHAEAAEPRELSEKVQKKMTDKNLFIGLCTHHLYV